MLEMVPARTYVASALLGLGVATTMTVGAAVSRPSPASSPTIDVVAVDEPAPVSSAAPERDAIADASVQLVFTLRGESYVALQELDPLALPQHGKLRMLAATGDDYIDAVIAPVAAKHAAPWAGRTFVVSADNAAGCSSVLSEFAIVARLSGDPGYAGIDSGGWTAQHIVEDGHPVLAAKLACRGTLARDAAARPAVVFTDVLDPADAMVARRLVLESQTAADLTAEWKAANMSGNWYDSNELVEKIVRDPRSGATWISVHAQGGFSCGDPEVNIWGLFRVESNGNLTTVALRRVDNLATIDELVDLDGDGVPELAGTSWLGPNSIVTDIQGNELARLDVPFFGCPC
jgi:hypothetical protein